MTLRVRSLSPYLMAILDKLAACFPNLARVSSYALPARPAGSHGTAREVEFASVVDVATCTVASREFPRATVTGSASGRETKPVRRI